MLFGKRHDKVLKSDTNDSSYFEMSVSNFLSVLLSFETEEAPGALIRGSTLFGSFLKTSFIASFMGFQIGFAGTFSFKSSISTFKILIRNFKSNLNPKKS